jgi:hypothetical protein
MTLQSVLQIALTLLIGALVLSHPLIFHTTANV